eukprot:5646326-Lingulodinium_polyedra.AAC.1
MSDESNAWAAGMMQCDLACGAHGARAWCGTAVASVQIGVLVQFAPCTTCMCSPCARANAVASCPARWHERRWCAA